MNQKYWVLNNKAAKQSLGFCFAALIFGSCSTQSVRQNDEYPFWNPNVATLSVAINKNPETLAFRKKAQEYKFRGVRWHQFRNENAKGEVILLSGTSSNLDFITTLATAKILYDQNWSVKVIPSPTHPDFFVPQITRPGDIAQETERLQIWLEDLLKKDLSQKRILVGISLGGLHGFKLKPSPLWSEIWALSPPVNLANSLGVLDSFHEQSRSPDRPSPEELTAFIEKTASGGPAVRIIDRFSNRDYQSLIAKVFYDSLEFILKNMPPSVAVEWVKKNLSYRNYLEAIVLPGKQMNLATWSQTFATWIQHCPENDRQIVFASLDDPLLSDNDRSLMENDACEKRQKILYRYGGHMGIINSQAFLNDLERELKRVAQD